MIDESLITAVQAGIGKVLALAGADTEDAAETDDKFDLDLHLALADLPGMLQGLQPYVAIFDISFDYWLDGLIEGSTRLNEEGLVADGPPDPFDPSESEYEPKTAEKITDFLTRLSPGQLPLAVDDFERQIKELNKDGVVVELLLHIAIDKKGLAQKLAGQDSLRVLFYLLAEKFLDKAQRLKQSHQYEWLLPPDKKRLLLLLGDVQGSGQGTGLALYGRDQWSNLPLQEDAAAEQKLAKSAAFRSDACHWQIAPTELTPFHLHLEQSTLDNPQIVGWFQRQRDELCAAYLANRTQISAGQLQCEFNGQRPVKVQIPGNNSRQPDEGLFSLFNWSYENDSSDKLGIVRQIIALSLTRKPEGNYSLLLEKAADLLASAKSNFDFYLRREVELYFQARMRVSEYLQKFSQAAGDELSSLTSELVSNLYKTVGLIIGVLIAALIDPDRTAAILTISSGLYLFYLLVIIFYQLRAVDVRFKNEVAEYHHSLAEMAEILDKDEITRLEGDIFNKAQRTFSNFYTMTLSIYIFLALASLIILISNWRHL